MNCTWTAANGNGNAVTNYLLRYSSNSGSTWTTIDTASTALTYSLTNLPKGPFIVQTAAINAFGQGAWSASSVSTATSVGVIAYNTANQMTAVNRLAVGGTPVSVTVTTNQIIPAEAVVMIGVAVDPSAAAIASPSTTPTITGSGAGLTWTTKSQSNGSAASTGSVAGAVYAYTPTALPSGTVFTITFSTAPTQYAYVLGVTYLTNVAQVSNIPTVKATTTFTGSSTASGTAGGTITLGDHVFTMCSGETNAASVGDIGIPTSGTTTGWAWNHMIVQDDLNSGGGNNAVNVAIRMAADTITGVGTGAPPTYCDQYGGASIAMVNITFAHS